LIKQATLLFKHNLQGKSFCWALLLMAFPLIAGCNGCRTETDENPKDEKQKQDPFSFSPARPFPRGEQPAGDRIKPGHWISASVKVRSNQNDSRGRLYAQTRSSRVNPEFAESTSKDIIEMSGTIKGVRPVVMPKGQERRFVFRILPPSMAGNTRGNCFIDNQFTADGAAIYNLGSGPVATLPSEEYFFVVLTTRPERFSSLAGADWIKPPLEEDGSERHTGNYRLVIPPASELLPLGDTALDWTSIAVLLWDDLPAEGLTPDQILAIRDWIHFGGRLIVNGSEAAEAIQNTVLAEYLPITPLGNAELDVEQATELLEKWSVDQDASTTKQTALLKGESSRVSLDGTPQSDAAIVKDTAGLVYQRSRGRGQIIQSRFDMTAPWLTNWRSFDSYFNGAILNRPRRGYVKFRESEFDAVNVMGQVYVDLNSLASTAAMNTQFRLLARDAVLIPPASSGSQPDPMATRPEYRNDGGSLGAWNDTSDVVRTCIDILKSESGIEIPKSSLVVRSLVWYLIALVPLNYLVFRLIGRPEYAWLAVPVIALAGAIWVAKSARLDIGFARSENQIGVLEVPLNYDRGHLCRVAAIYNSLSTKYDVAFSDGHACASPITYQMNKSSEGSAVEFQTSFADGPTMSGLQIDSNQVRLIHAEQIVDLEGTFSLADGKLANRTPWELLDAVLVRRTKAGKLETANVGLVSPRSSQSVKWKPNPQTVVADDLPLKTEVLIRQLSGGFNVGPGESRLVGRIDGEIPGMSIQPGGAQIKRQTVVVAYLRNAPSPQPEKDANLVPPPRSVSVK
jgi:hypothetical protein